MQRGGGSTIDEGLSIASDALNNTYTTGYFTSSANFDSLNISSAGLEDVFIVKSDSSGYLKWIKRDGGINSDKALSIDADAIPNNSFPFTPILNLFVKFLENPNPTSL